MNKSKTAEDLKLRKGTEILPPARLTTGLPSLDLVLGGGWPRGRIVLLAGQKESGKSYLAYRAIAEEHKGNPQSIAVLLDAEGCYTPDWGAAIGIDNERLLVHQPTYMEDAYNTVIAAIDKLRPQIVVLDSLASLAPEKELEKAFDESKARALAAVLTNSLMRSVQSSINAWRETPSDEAGPHPPVIIIIQHMYLDPSVPYLQYVIRGGRTQEYMASLVIECNQAEGRKSRLFAETETEDGTVERHVGWKFRWAISKSKVSPSGIPGVYKLYTRDVDGFHAGDCDDSEAILRLAIQFGIVQRKGAWFVFGEEKVQGEERALKWAEDGRLYPLVAPLVRRLYDLAPPEEVPQSD